MEQQAAVNPTWRTATYTNNGGGNCVEVGVIGRAVLIRDTKDNGAGPVLRVPPAAWRSFTTVLRTSPHA